MKFTEQMIKKFAEPLSKTEEEKCKRAIEAIRDALLEVGYTDDEKGISLLENDTGAYSISMRNRCFPEKVHIFIQGSYANNTCVRNESDVDIAVLREDVYEYAFDLKFDTSSGSKKIDAMLFKGSIERSLQKKFPNQVKRGNKSIKVEGNTYRKKSDVVPCIAMHYYNKTHLKDYQTFQEGIIILGDDGTITRNFPRQHIANGKSKNVQTNYFYKKMVRIIKKMRYLMIDCGYKSADEVSSFGLESLLWNLPNECFTKYSYYYGLGFREVLRCLYNNKDKLPFYYEANGIKMLCPGYKEVEAYVNFIEDLNRFYQYDEWA